MNTLTAPSCVMGICRDDPVRPLVVTRVRVCARCERDKGESKRLLLWLRLNGFGEDTLTHGECGECLSKTLAEAGLSRQRATLAIQKI